MSQSPENIQGALIMKTTHQMKIGIIGMGYVGLPLAVEFARKNIKVTGFEIDSKKVSALKKGISYIEDVPSSLIEPFVQSGILSITTNFHKLRTVNAIIICVPTPLRKTKDPDISYIISSVKKISANLKRGHIIILESTTYPGTTREIVLPILEQNGKKVGKDFN
ncbi:MAG: UDP-N-acetyl-D-glucosamine dehydrogenase, partial [Elusimicrobia bacterium]|nr:UDP-N-acetyl-D-glucosamine dehydrogenase [Elusimicrobiota bacterium]MBD3412158.1 UDP-N-acetyl-D-glucosamine dehydrogenase [Elusimicrobiota bacterium]